jgi:hypothetical protein
MDNLGMKFYQVKDWIVKKLEDKLPVAVIELLLIQLFYFVIILIVSVLVYIAPHSKIWSSFEHEINFIAVVYTGFYYMWLLLLYLLVTGIIVIFTIKFYNNCKLLFKYFSTKGVS